LGFDGTIIPVTACMDRIIVASNSISNFIKFQSRICHFDQQGKEESEKRQEKEKQLQRTG